MLPEGGQTRQPAKAAAAWSLMAAGKKAAESPGQSSSTGRDQGQVQRGRWRHTLAPQSGRRWRDRLPGWQAQACWAGSADPQKSGSASTRTEIMDALLAEWPHCGARTVSVHTGAASSDTWFRLSELHSGVTPRNDSHSSVGLIVRSCQWGFCAPARCTCNLRALNVIHSTASNPTGFCLPAVSAQ